METFSRNLHIVLEFASRVDLYGDRELIMDNLRALRLRDAQTGCRRALEACHRDWEAQGYSRPDIAQTPTYRRLLQLDEMIVDLTDSFNRRTGQGPLDAPDSGETRGAAFYPVGQRAL